MILIVFILFIVFRLLTILMNYRKEINGRVNLLLPDPMHQIDLGVIFRLIMAIIRKYWERVLQFLKEGNEGLAAKKLQARLNLVLARRTQQDGRM